VRRSNSKFGLTDEEWDTAMAELRDAILEAASEGRFTTYGEVASKINSVAAEPHSALMNQLLGAVFEEEHAHERPALTALVTHKDGDQEPGRGFYDMARSLGYRFSEPYVFWAQQVQEVWKLYGPQSSRD
jgi:hypothetical protein